MNGVYILRTVGPADFNPNNGQQKLAGLDAKLFGEQSTILTAVAEVVDDDEKGETDTTKQSKYMRLSTVINLESRLSVCRLLHALGSSIEVLTRRTDWLRWSCAERAPTTKGCRVPPR
jgi:hypothetical protein